MRKGFLTVRLSNPEQPIQTKAITLMSEEELQAEIANKEKQIAEALGNVPNTIKEEKEEIKIAFVPPANTVIHNRVKPVDIQEQYIPKCVWLNAINNTMSKRATGKVIDVPGSDRVDVMDENYRMTIMQLFGGVFEIGMYIRLNERGEIPQLIIKNVKYDKIELSIHILLNNYKQLK